MFTGIISAVGTLESIEMRADAARLNVAAGALGMSDVQLGDSIAVSGPCLTVVSFDAQSFEVDVSHETLARTTLGDRRRGDPVNLARRDRYPG